MKQSLPTHGLLGTSHCWQSSRPAVAKDAFQNEMVNMAASCHREGTKEGCVFDVVSWHHLLVVRMGNSRSICSDSQISEANIKMNGTFNEPR